MKRSNAVGAAVALLLSLCFVISAASIISDESPIDNDSEFTLGASSSATVGQRWSYNSSFVSEWESVCNNSDGGLRFGVQMPSWVTKSGSTFSGIPSSSGTYKIILDVYNVGDNKTDAYEEIVITVSSGSSGGSTTYYTITYDKNGATRWDLSYTSQRLISGTSVNLPTSSVIGKLGADLTGWLINGTVYAPGEAYTIRSNVTATAQWSSMDVRVDYFTNGANETVDSVYAKHGDTITLPSGLTKTGYTFAGWTINRNLTGIDDGSRIYSPGASYTLSSYQSFYAIWTPLKYTVTFESNGGSQVSSQQVNYNETVTRPSDPSKDGNTFVGWYTDEGLITVYNFSTPITGDLTLYAKWIPAVYTVTFNTNGGSLIPSQSVEHNQAAEEPASPAKSGNTFVGWYLDSDLTAAFDFSTPVTSDLTLYAKWSPIKYTVTFESNGGSKIDSQQIEYGKTVTQPQNPTRFGLNFAGWYTDIQCTKLYYFSTPVTADVTLYAKWLEHGYQINFDSNGGSKVDSQTVADGSVVQRPSNPIKDGYLFASWMDGSNNDYDFTKIVSDSFTLYAKWTNYFSVTMNESKATLIIDNGYSAYSHIVDWGDGQVSNSSTMLTLAHDYEKSGDYTITLTSKRGDATVSAQFHVSALGGSDPVPGGDDDPKDDNTGDKKDYTAVIVFVVLAIVCLLLGCVLKPFWMGTVVFLILAVIAAALISSGVI